MDFESAPTPVKLHDQYKTQRSFCISSGEIKTKMEMKKLFYIVGVLTVLAIVSFNGAYGVGECGKANPNMEAMKLIPCASAAQDANAPVSSKCCAQVKTLGRNPKCLCAVMLSDTAKSSGVNPEIAITIPKRCNLADRPVGYKCGPYTLP